MRVKHPLRTAMNLVFRHTPVEAQLIVTRRCNLSCGYCSEYDQTSAMIPLDVLKQRIDALHKLHVANVTLLGGEPLMHPQLPEIVAYADRRAQTSVTTNGFLITGDLIHRLNGAGLMGMEVSIDTVKPDRSAYIQKCLKTVVAKLGLLRRLAEFEVSVNLVLCEQTRPDFKDTIRELSGLGFAVSIDLLHDPKGKIAIGGEEYLGLWEYYYAEATPYSYLEQEYGAQLLQGARPHWKCQAGARFLYVDEFGNAQFCSAQRGRLNKPVVEYTRRDARQHARAYKGCEAGCSLLCHYRDSSLDNRPFHTIKSMLKLLVRSGPVATPRELVAVERVAP